MGVLRNFLARRAHAVLGFRRALQRERAEPFALRGVGCSFGIRTFIFQPRSLWALRLCSGFFGGITGLSGADESSPQHFDLPAGDAEKTLLLFSSQSGRQVIFPTELAKGVGTRSVTGDFQPRDALDGMLDGSPLFATEDINSGVFALARIPLRSVKERLGSHAIIVIGLTANSTQAARLHDIARRARRGFMDRGVPEKSVVIFESKENAPVRRDSLLAALRDIPAPVEETWILLLGLSANAHGGKSAYQLSGPRLSAEDLAKTVGDIPGKKYVVIATTKSGGFLPPLLPFTSVEAVAATADAGEINEPRFTPMWVDALLARPEADFHSLAVAAALRVEDFYQKTSLGVGEHAELIDRTLGKILTVPFTPESVVETAMSPSR